MHVWFRIVRLPSLLGLMVSLVSWQTVAFGAEWSLVPKFETRGQYNDNIRLTTAPHSAVWSARLGPSLQMRYATEITSFKANPKVEYLRYFWEGGDEGNEESFVNYFLPFSGSYMTETDRFSLNAAFNRDNAFTTELQESGIVTDFIPRNTQTAVLGWDHGMTERLTWQASYQFFNVIYEDGQDSGLFDFQTHTGSLGPQYDWTENTQLSSTLWYSHSRFQDIGFRTQSAGVDLGVSHNLFETLTVTATAGGRYVHTTSRFDRCTNRINQGVISCDSNLPQFLVDREKVTEKDSNFVWLVSLSVEQRWERSRISIGYSRSLNPNGNGALLETDRVNLHIGHEYSELITLSLDGFLIFNDTVENSGRSSRVTDTRYWRVSPSLTWRATENWIVNLSYRYSNLKNLDNSTKPATSHAVNLGVTYTWPQWSVSR